MKITALPSRPFIPPQDNFYEKLDEALTRVPERTVVSISSKVVAIGEGRCVKIPEGVDAIAFKDSNARKEADLYIVRDPSVDYGRFFTIKNGILIGSAGIDQSNGNGYLILWPQNPMKSAHDIRAHLMNHHAVRELGVIISDSTSTPLRNGVTGVAIGYAGFHAQHDYRGKPDIFGRLLKAERLNVADSLATCANLVMGEGDECTPFVSIEEVPHLTFADTEVEDPFLTLTVPMEKDIFSMFFKGIPWEQGETYNKTKQDE